MSRISCIVFVQGNPPIPFWDRARDSFGTAEPSLDCPRVPWNYLSLLFVEVKGISTYLKPPAITRRKTLITRRSQVQILSPRPKEQLRGCKSAWAFFFAGPTLSLTLSVIPSSTFAAASYWDVKNAETYKRDLYVSMIQMSHVAPKTARVRELRRDMRSTPGS